MTDVGLGSSANTAVIGHLGSAAVAANSVAQVARQLATVVVFGISHATAIYLGKTIGEQKLEHAKAYAKRFHLSQPDSGSGRRAGDPGGRAELPTLRWRSVRMQKDICTFMFFVMSYFTIAQSLNCTMVVGMLPFRRGYQVRAYHGRVYHVGILHTAGRGGRLRISCKRADQSMSY